MCEISCLIFHEGVEKSICNSIPARINSTVAHESDRLFFFLPAKEGYLPFASHVLPDLLTLMMYWVVNTEFLAYTRLPSHLLSKEWVMYSLFVNSFLYTYMNVVTSKPTSFTTQFSVPINTRSPASNGCYHKTRLVSPSSKRSIDLQWQRQRWWLQMHPLPRYQR